MTSKAYSSHFLASFYDRMNPPGPAEVFYLSLPGPTPKRILDIGSGTGWLAIEFARQGHHVTGVEPADGMISLARNRDGGDTVRWIESRIADLALDEHFDLAVMTGHVAQVFTSEGGLHNSLKAIRRHMAPGGLLAFETRNPAARAWEGWTVEGTRRGFDVPGMGRVHIAYRTDSVRDGVVAYTSLFEVPSMDGGMEINDLLRFWTYEELALHLGLAGFTVQDCYGNWDRAPLADVSPEIIVLARAG